MTGPDRRLHAPLDGREAGGRPGALTFPVPPGASPGLRAIYLHGAASGPWVWADGFAARIAAAGFPGLALPVQGRDDGLSDYARDLRAALERPSVLIGHSLGALVAQRLLDHPMVRGAALLAPVPPEGLFLSNARLALADPALWAEVARMTEAGVPSPRVVRALFGPRMDPRAAARHVARLSPQSRAALIEAQVPQPVVPGWIHGRRVLVLGAAEDRLIPPDAVRRCAAWHGAGAEFLEGAGHLMMLDVGWPATAERVVRWLETVPG
ncbi:alpha/beta hydrolase [Roseomonas sp. CCTCC AB2023176]|uniref:alpha/beta hydrolase n=1 Tax=Roseomonas sp. CCTCC AB2023176 TaxID=3342640 RepID=UPI0035E22BF5